MITGINHATIMTAKLEETRDFFVKVIGLEEGYRPPFEGIDGIWLYGGGTPIVHLVVDDGKRTPAGAIDHFSLTTDNMDTALARLKEHSVDYFLAGFPDGIGGQAFFSDPNGVKVEITYRPKA